MTHAQKPSIDSEMHELNAEADFLDQKTITANSLNGDTKLHSHHSDPDAQEMVIESLRSQVQDLFSQVSQLNNKLVHSYDRVSDLEDELHVTSANLRQATLKASQLEFERTQHLSALSTGLLVEKSHVTMELTRLMEKATEEAARRGQAESARAEIEKDLDDLSAGLFDQANTMVAKARIGEAKSARKLEETEAALRSAEEVVRALQSQMQELQSEKEKTDRRLGEIRIRMGKGKWVDRGLEGTRSSRPRLISSHLPYHEFLVFVSHLRAIRPASTQPPAMSTLLPLPFLARLVAEDSDPTVRLDLAPSLNWLSRRSVVGAIHGGQLAVEPIQFTTLLEELAPPNIPATSHHTHIVCALCGMPIYSSSESPASTPTTPNSSRTGSQTGSWSTALFKTVRNGEINITTPFIGHGRHSAQFGPPSTDPPTQVYIFRLDATPSGLPVSLAIASQQPGTPTRQSIYPLCTTGWCLARLRSTCSLWAFVRTSIVEKIWEEPPIAGHANSASDKSNINGLEKKHDRPNGIVTDEQKSVPIQPAPRRPKVGGTFGSLWGSMQRSLSGTSPLGKENEVSKTPLTEAVRRDEGKPKLPPRDPSRRTLPPPPPSHPSIAHSPKSSVSQASEAPVSSVHAVPPPVRETAPPPPPALPPRALPPPLPKRSRGREARTATPDPEQKVEPDGEENPTSQPIRTDSQGTEQPVEESTISHAEPAAAPEDEAVHVTQEEPAAAPQPETSKEETDIAPTEGEDLIASKPELHIRPDAISRGTSTDSFSTPTEDLAPHLSTSPAEPPAPLPQSQDSSPEKTPTSEQPPAAETIPSTAPVSEVSAPAKPAVLRDERPPSRTASPVPPPLPRRAAARARPTSTLVAQSAESVKRDSIDTSPASGLGAASSAEPLTTATEPQVQVQESKEVNSMPNPVPSDAVAPNPAPSEDAATHIEDRAPHVDQSASEVEEPTSVTDEPEELVHSEEALVPAETDNASTADGAEQPKPEVDAQEEPHVNGDVSETETSSELPPTYPDSEVEDEIATDVVQEEDNGQYIGDMTWEERTYKELVRLREEMFWARIGAVVH